MVVAFNVKYAETTVIQQENVSKNQKQTVIVLTVNRQNIQKLDVIYMAENGVYIVRQLVIKLILVKM